MVISEEYEVSLIVKGYRCLALELGDLGKKASKHSANGVAESGGKVVKYELGFIVGRRLVSAMDLVGQFN